MMLARLGLALSIVLVGCSAETDEGEDVGTDDAELAQSPKGIAIGFNGGVDQFEYWPDFFRAEKANTNARLCHTYLAWNIADQDDGAPNPSGAFGTRRWFKAWLEAAKGHCNEALISFKAHANGKAPTEAAYTVAVRKFLETKWSPSIRFAIAPWNEPNNGADDGNGLGKPIEPELAAHYYLSTVRLCATHGCRAVAGDFASNGNYWNAFEWNCAPEDVDAKNPERCTDPSPLAKGRGPSYLDRYKAVIVRHATAYGLRAGFRPAVFAYHGWHDVNGYLLEGTRCTSYDNCAILRVLKNLGGSWSGVDLWDTETGMGQRGALDDDEQACGAAFLVRHHAAVSPRIKRIYVTRLHGGDLRLLDGHTPRPAMNVLANRQTSYKAGRCK